MNDQLPPGKQLHWHRLSESRCTWISRLYPAMIWEKIQSAKRIKSDLHVVWLDLANAYGSVPHQLISYALDFFHIPPCIRTLIAGYFNNFHICYTSTEVSTAWHRLEKENSNGMFHLPHPLHSSLWSYPHWWKTDGQRSQISVTSATPRLCVASWMMSPLSSRRRHVPTDCWKGLKNY